MTQSHHCWFFTHIWKLDHLLNMTLGTDIKFVVTFLSAKSLCWWKWILSYFKTEKLWGEDNLNTNGRGLSSDVDSAMLSVHIHRSLQHSKASRYFQTVAELHLSFCSRFIPLKAQSLRLNWGWRECACANFHSPKVYPREPRLCGLFY